jgi:hypothetical protein
MSQSDRGYIREWANVTGHVTGNIILYDFYMNVKREILILSPAFSL